jgi:hypothetical protein
MGRWNRQEVHWPIRLVRPNRGSCLESMRSKKQSFMHHSHSGGPGRVEGWDDAPARGRHPATMSQALHGIYPSTRLDLVPAICNASEFAFSSQLSAVPDRRFPMNLPREARLAAVGTPTLRRCGRIALRPPQDGCIHPHGRRPWPIATCVISSTGWSASTN